MRGRARARARAHVRARRPGHPNGARVRARACARAQDELHEPEQSVTSLLRQRHHEHHWLPGPSPPPASSASSGPRFSSWGHRHPSQLLARRDLEPLFPLVLMMLAGPPPPPKAPFFRSKKAQNHRYGRRFLLGMLLKARSGRPGGRGGPMMPSGGGSAALHGWPIAKARASALAGTQRRVARFRSLRLRPPTQEASN